VGGVPTENVGEKKVREKKKSGKIAANLVDLGFGRELRISSAVLSSTNRD
jgi:hypothetical protein